MPELGHGSHKDQGHADESDTGENYPFCADAVNYRAGRQSKRQSSDQKSQQKTLSELRAVESQRIGERGIKNGKSIKNYADREKQIEKRRNDNPPAIEDSG